MQPPAPTDSAAHGTVPNSAAQTSEQILCPGCGHANSPDVEFCTACHHMLIYRCPKCWHTQRTPGKCESCGIVMAAYSEMALERAMKEEDRLWWAKFWSAASAFVQILFLPFMTVGSLVRDLILRLANMALWR